MRKFFNGQFACMWLRSLTHRRIHRKVMGVFPAVFFLLLSHWVASLDQLRPFHELERAFYKSTAGVLFADSCAGALGKEPSVLAEYLC